MRESPRDKKGSPAAAHATRVTEVPRSKMLCLTVSCIEHSYSFTYCVRIYWIKTPQPKTSFANLRFVQLMLKLNCVYWAAVHSLPGSDYHITWERGGGSGREEMNDLHQLEMALLHFLSLCFLFAGGVLFGPL